MHQLPWLDAQQAATTALQCLQAIQGTAASMQLLFCHTPGASQQLIEEVRVQYTTPDGASHTEVLIPAATLAGISSEGITHVAGQDQPAAAAAPTFAASLETLQELAGRQAAVVCYLGAQGVQLVRGLQLSRRHSVGQLLRGGLFNEGSLFPEPLQLSMQAVATPSPAGPAAGPQLLASLLGAAVGAVDWAALFQQQSVKEEAAAAAPVSMSAAAAVPHRVLAGEAARGKVEVKLEAKPAAAGAAAADSGSQLPAPHPAAVEPAALLGAACAAGAPFLAPPAGLPRVLAGARGPGKGRAAPDEEDAAAVPAKRQRESKQQAPEGAAAATPAADASPPAAAAAPAPAADASPPAAAAVAPAAAADLPGAADVQALKCLTCGMAGQAEMGGSLGESMVGSPVKQPLPAPPVEAGAPQSPPAQRAEAAACPTAAEMAAGELSRGQGLTALVVGGDGSLVAAVAGQEGPSEAAAMAVAAIVKWLPPGLMEGAGGQGPVAADVGAGGSEAAAAAATAIVQFRDTGSVPSSCSLLFEKELQPNDVLKHNLIVPKQAVQQHWGAPMQEVELEVEDLTGNAYTWRLKPQPNGNRIKYVICGWSSFLHTWRLTRGSTVQLYRTPGGSYLATCIPPGSNQHALEPPTST